MPSFLTSLYFFSRGHSYHDLSHPLFHPLWLGPFGIGGQHEFVWNTNSGPTQSTSSESLGTGPGESVFDTPPGVLMHAQI